MGDFNFNCPHCKQSLEAPEEMLGTDINCPMCNGQVQLPKPEPIPPPQKPPMRVDLHESPSGGGQGQWYYSLNGKRLGPTNNDDLRQLMAAGVLDNETLVWKDGFDNWVSIGQTTLRQIVTTPPPLSGVAVNNGLVWAVAFVPIWGTLLAYVIANATGIGVGFLWFITLALNITFCVIDDSILKNAGHDTRKFGGWAWLVPVYLFKRAKALKQSLAYFITWLACFSVSLFL